MDTIRFVLRDAERTATGTVPEPLARTLVAGLSADPYRLDDLFRATGRFLHPVHVRTIREAFCEFATGIPDRGELLRLDASAMVDLQHRLVFLPWDQREQPIPVAYVAPEGLTQLCLPYTIHPQWLITQHWDRWDELADRARDRLPPWFARDRRKILYGASMMRFLVESLTQRKNKLQQILASLPESSEARLASEELRHEVRAIHAEWLLQPVETWHGRTVREAMLADFDHLMMDQRDREMQWALQGNCPVTLDQSDGAFRWGGFAETEIMLYYGLVRVLLYQRILRLADQNAAFESMGNEISRMEERRDAWLAEPQTQSVGEYSPAQLILRERTRKPFASDEASADFQCDCPLCRVMPETAAGPMFFRIEIDSLDHDWPFGTEPDAHSDSSTAEREPEIGSAMIPSAIHPEDDTLPDFGSRDSVWQYVMLHDESEPLTPELAIFTMAACTGELIEDLKQRGAPRPRIDELLSLIDDFASAVREPDQQPVQPAVHRFCNTLDQVERDFPELSAKTNDLQNRLVRRIQVS